MVKVVLEQGLAGSASRLVVMRRESSTGKARVAYEATDVRLADWQLNYPLDPGALKEQLEACRPTSVRARARRTASQSWTWQEPTSQRRRH
jgi:hypothetical protein